MNDSRFDRPGDSEGFDESKIIADIPVIPTLKIKPSAVSKTTFMTTTAMMQTLADMKAGPIIPKSFIQAEVVDLEPGPEEMSGPGNKNYEC